MRLKRQGNGIHSNARSARRTTATVRDGRRATSSATGSATGTSRSAAGRPWWPGITASAIALRVLRSAAPSPGARLQPGDAGAPTLPASE